MACDHGLGPGGLHGAHEAEREHLLDDVAPVHERRSHWVTGQPGVLRVLGNGELQ